MTRPDHQPDGTPPERGDAATPNDTILLTDLVPKRDVRGGARKLLFGEEGPPPDDGRPR